MPGQAWNDDWPGELARIQQNAAALIRSIAHEAHDWSTVPGATEVLDWHTRLYEDCRVPVAGYVGHFRGNPTIKELIGYEVGVGRRQPDGLTEKVGVYSKDLAVEIPTLITQIQAGIRQLDSVLEPGRRPVMGEAVEAVVLLAARIHGEGVRIHPFANGNGRTERVWEFHRATLFASCLCSSQATPCRHCVPSRGQRLDGPSAGLHRRQWASHCVVRADVGSIAGQLRRCHCQ